MGAAGLLDDQAAMAWAALALFQATATHGFLDDARRHVAAAERFFADGRGGFFLSASDAVDVPLGPAARPRTATDGPSPSGVGLMGQCYARLFHVTGEDEFRRRAEALGAAFAGDGDQLAHMPTLLSALDALDRAAVVVIVGGDGAAADALAHVALGAPDPATLLLRVATMDGLPEAHPAFGKRPPAGHRAAAFVCRAGVCGLPVTDAAALRADLRRAPLA